MVIQTDLFSRNALEQDPFPEREGVQGCIEKIVLPDAELSLVKHWCSVQESQQLFASLSETLAWEQSTISLYGKSVKIPRLNAWYGDPGSRYQYSGTSFDPLPWTPLLLELKRRIERQLDCAFNSVLANLYRDGRDSVSWHADNEPELGLNPVIASLSLGETRQFLLKHRSDKSLSRLSLSLSSGSLLMMAGATQHHWVHSVPKSARELGARINLTFRRVS
jgi:alkylated DNA repair dioxygenase AlkB